MKQIRLSLLVIGCALLTSYSLAAEPLQVLVVTGQHGYDKPAFALFYLFRAAEFHNPAKPDYYQFDGAISKWAWG